MKTGIFITVRTGSTRLPQKSLKTILPETKCIEFLIDRVKKSKRCDEIILCTTERQADNILCDIAKEKGIKYFRGSEQDKLDRWLGAANKYSIDFFVTADGDDLLCDPHLLDLGFEQYFRNTSDFIQGTGLVCGSFTYGISTKALKKVCEIKDSTDTEMMWVYFTETGLFEIEELENVSEACYRDDIRMTMDYEDDYQFFKTILTSFKDPYSLSTEDVVELLEAEPHIKEINFYLHEKWKQNQINKTRLKVK